MSVKKNKILIENKRLILAESRRALRFHRLLQTKFSPINIAATIFSYSLPLALLILFACNTSPAPKLQEAKPSQFIVVLGIAQDAGYPQSGCAKKCCTAHWEGKVSRKNATALGLVDSKEEKLFLFEATPDFREQWHELQKNIINPPSQPDGIFLTHAHIGHYTGLMQLGKEVMGASNSKVYTMPKMASFLESNGPWEQLVSTNNIHLQKLKNDSSVQVSENLHVTPFLVPHRDEYSETVGFTITGSKKKVLFIPDINKWDQWSQPLADVIANVDMAFIDGTFYRNGELPNRDMSQVPHPFVEETMTLLKDIDAKEKSKVHFIHFNHTNPLITDERVRNELLEAGFKIAKEGQIVEI